MSAAGHPLSRTRPWRRLLIRHRGMGMGVVYLVIFVIPLLAGLWQLLAEGMAASHLALLLAQPGLWHSAALSLWIGAASTLGSLLLTALLLAHSDSRAFGLLRRLLSPMLAMPHVAFAIGFAFLLAPSGWLLRLASPALTGFELPPTGRPFATL